ncbi:adrenodoxin reductase [Salpingoeca rosetta]|uniref:NADPH:adrenodoxin oxidoreductase, mitochondrial n=1 Tax=Salpingoeca rosetta (strain ATCC 50818 / BSB-021) TaxID=946362 RepID=F2UG30_SALR5|nr:adrenodoxin reductase [Salpingoeca rosetta]EGD75458.1 adrenodoxin reductase [Salpingoeca rosetta]|eukprot:XP_004991915.1 adrenodoxin reductase [Salpingoeca rosetta]
MAGLLRRGARQIAVVGGGPSGFYTAQYLLKYLGGSLQQLDMFERLPAPYGLVRYGVAPDHPEVKNCIAQFEAVAENPAFRFFGNVPVGDTLPGQQSVKLEELREAYDAVVLSYGTIRERRLGVPGEDLGNVISAREFVGWYNGHPEHQQLPADLHGKNVVIVGQGNVALDCARMLLADPSYLRKTDITETALQHLHSSGIQRVSVVGRRGPIEAAFTIKELRELTKLSGVACHVDKHHVDFTQDERDYIKATRRITRMMKLLADVAVAPDTHADGVKHCDIQFFLSPKEFRESTDNGGRVGEVVFNVMKLEGDIGRRRAVPTGQERTLPADLVIKSIGYQGHSIDPALPYDPTRNVIRHDGVGRVSGLDGVYCSGWIKNGPAGIIATTMVDANNTARAIADDFSDANAAGPTAAAGSGDGGDDRDDKREQLVNRIAPQAVSFEQWKKLEAWERQQGKQLGKPAEKCTDAEQMLHICHNAPS